MIVDPQVDFITGSLPVCGAAAAMDALAEFLKTHKDDYEAIVITRDNHPAQHCSFSSNGGQWPDHCVAGTYGSEIWPSLSEVAADAVIFNKGERPDREEYSIFANEKAAASIDSLIREQGIEQIDICGLAGDICVAETMKDGRKIYGDSFFNLLPEYSPTIG